MGWLLLAACDPQPEPPFPETLEVPAPEVEPPRDLGRDDKQPATAPPRPVVTRPSTNIEATGELEVVLPDVAEVTEFQLTPRDYYVASGTGRVSRISREDGRLIAALEDVAAIRLAATDDALFFTTSRTLVRWDHDSTPRVVVDSEAVESLDGCLELALDDEYAYFTAFQNPGIFRVPLSGGSIETLSEQRRPGSLALSDAHVYFASFFRRRVGRLDKSGGRTETIRSTVAGPVAMALDGTRVIALLETSGEVVALDPRSRKQTLLGNASKNPQALLVANGQAYWSTGKVAPGDRSFIRRVSTTGGATETLVHDDGLLRMFQLEAGWLYFGSTREASILRLRVDEPSSD
jgi:hypothetical protein